MPNLAPLSRAPLLLTALCLLALAAPAPSEPLANLPQAVAQLGAEEFQLREQASHWLWSQGAAAIPTLKAAVTHPDAEVRLRARVILDKLELGITPDSPPDIYPKIDRFRRGDVSAKLRSLQELIAQKQIDLAIRLTEGEPPGDDRNQLYNYLAGQFPQLVGDAVRSGNLDLAEKLLLPGSAVETQLERLAAFYRLTGRLGDRLTAAKTAFAAQPSSDNALRLFWFARAQGDVELASAALPQVSNARLKFAYYLEQADYRAALQVLDDPTLALQPLEKITLRAGLQHRAGDAQAATAALDQIPALLANSTSDTWQAAEAYFAAERPKEALNLLHKTIPAAAFYYHFYRHEYEQAFALAQITPGKKLDRAWLAGLPEGGLVKTQMLIGRETYARDIARALHYVGRLEEAKAICDALREEARKPSSTAWNALVHGEVLMGERKQALADASEALASGRTTADAILNHFYADDKKKQSLLRYFYVQLARGGWPKSEVLPVLDRVLLGHKLQTPDEKRLQASLATLQIEASHTALLQLGELALVRGERPAALDLFSKAVSAGSTEAAVRLGDLAAEDQRWDEAAKWYATAYEKIDGWIYVRYLHGRALEKSGRVEEGRKQQQLAEMLALSPTSRYSLAFSLRERNLSAEAAQQLELSLFTASPTTNAAQSAGQLLGNMIYKEDPQRSAILWDRWQLSMLQTNFNYTLHESYLNDPTVIHRARAVALQRAGKQAAAAEEFLRALDFAPGNIRIVEEAVLQFDAAGAKVEADRIYDRCAATYGAIINSYPQSSVHRRFLALLSARTKRRLDDALVWAKESVALRPDLGTCYETLAEVHFARGELDQALAANAQADKTEPDSAKRYAEQRQRFTRPRPPQPPPEA